MSEQVKTPSIDDAPSASAEIRIRVSRGDFEFFFFFKPLSEAVLRRYRQIYSGPPGSRRGKPEHATQYMFRAVFLRTEGIDISKHTEPQGDKPAAYSSEADFWLNHPEHALWSDAALDGYLANQRPESDDTKG